MHSSQDNETNMISMFNDDDRTFGVEKSMTMKKQISDFKTNVKYTKLNVDSMRKMHDLTILKKEPDLGDLVLKESAKSTIDLSKFDD